MLTQLYFIENSSRSSGDIYLRLKYVDRHQRIIFLVAKRYVKGKS